ncbi:PREDICTED: uncharacterized protein LOC106344824 [Brassica oleracea var. oleracea]|uniref:uncharacterized protein LOC106344824 n=1 Tax=Brassica oleracea var. oleracea TaxID=109376 RepID=UPI0006A722B2|nr:PREDICTED: uncharacterized protein LOC106344824 [Brassica oleracea var. oleracea]
MEMFKSIVSKVDVPDHIAVESLMNTLHIKSPFWADLYRHPTRSVPDSNARSNNFIRMEEDTRAKAAKEAAGKQTPARTNDARQEIPPVPTDLRDKLGRKTDSKDLRTFLKRKAEMVQKSEADLRTSLDKSKARKTTRTGAALHLQPQPVDLREKINSKAEDLRAKLSQPKQHDLRPCLEAKRQAQRELMKVTNTPHLNVIMGGSPPCGDSVRAVKDYRRQAITAQKWPSQVEADHQISFSVADTHGISMPHNDPLLIDIGIDECQVTKVLVDTCSSVDLIFRDMLDKMGVDLHDMKPSSRILTGFNGSSEQMVGTICLPVYADDVTRTVKFSVIRARAPYNAILGTPWLHSVKAFPSTYHQCVKFPGKDGTTQTIRGDQRAAREILIAAVKLQQSPSLVNAVTKPIHKIYPQKEEIHEVPIDGADPSKVVRIGAYLSDDLQSLIISFLKENASTFAWVTSDMKGIDPAITSHELNVDPTFKPIRQKRRKLGPERSKAVNEEVDRLLDAGFIAEVRYLEWLANPVFVKKKNGKWCICVDFTDLNKACPKDSYPLPHIDRLVESTSGNELLTFMDAFSGYNQIMMHTDDREKTAFITDSGTYCYKIMPFGLKNA